MGRDSVPFGGGQIALRLNHQEDRGFAQLKLLLFGIEGLAGEDGGLVGGIDLGFGLNDADHGGAHLLGDIIFPLLQLGLKLPPLQKRAGRVGLGGTVANGDREIDTERIVRVVALEGLAQGLSKPRRSTSPWAPADRRWLGYNPVHTGTTLTGKEADRLTSLAAM